MVLKNSILHFINTKFSGDFDPYYIYDTQQIREHCRAFQNIPYKNKKIHFASMANSNLSFLNVVKEENINIFVNSEMHLDVAMKAGFSGEDIIFTSSALSEKTLRTVHDSGARLNLDSPGQLDTWITMFPHKEVGIRCNIGDKIKPFSTHAGYFIGKESRLGFLPEEIIKLKDKSRICGLHLYAGTDIFDIDYFISCYKQLIDIAKSFSNLQYLNFGGGFGVSENGDKHFDMQKYSDRVSKLMNDTSHQFGKEMMLILEPGRIIGGEAGYFVSYVTDIKKRDEEQLVGINASIVQFSRPLFYPETARHPVMILRHGELLSDSSDRLITSIYGCSTYSRDLFRSKILLPEIKKGDVVVFGNAGSYSASSYTHFLGFKKPDEYFL